MSRTTAIFSKRPRAGQVKTRLCPPLDAGLAAELALAMLEDTVARCLASDEFQTELRVAPPGAEAWFREHFPDVASVRPQLGADLGARLANFFELGAGERPGDSRVVIGSDAPRLSNTLVVQAHAALEEGADLVLGPDQGGGYYLVGLRASHPELFTEVEMSGGNMYAATLGIAKQLGLEPYLLEPSRDVDREEDLQRLKRELAGTTSPGESSDFPHRTARFLAQLEIE